MLKQHEDQSWKAASKSISANMLSIIRAKRRGDVIECPVKQTRGPLDVPYPQADFSQQRKAVALTPSDLEALGRVYDSFPKDSTPFNETYINQTFFFRKMEDFGGELIRLAQVGLEAEQRGK